MHLLRSTVLPVVLHATRAALTLDPADVSTGVGTDADSSTDDFLRYALNIYIHLFDNLQPYLPSELALLLQELWLPAIESTFTTIAQKQRILDMIRYIMRTPRAVMQLFYNYDYHRTEWKVMERSHTHTHVRAMVFPSSVPVLIPFAISLV